jgi:hypothetical protein
MARKPAAVEQTEKDQIAWYKWEFLRRNPEYCKEYESFRKKFGLWFHQHGEWYDRRTHYDPEALAFFEENIEPRIEGICERWQISDACPPDWEFNKSGFHPNCFFTVCLPTYCCSTENPDAGWDLQRASDAEDNDHERVARPEESKEEPSSDHECVLKLDLTLASSDLLRQARFQIRKLKREYDTLHRTPVPSVRRRIKHYAVYLRVSDLRAQGMTFAEIGKLVFPGQEGSEQHASDSSRRAQELIEGGYKELR